MSFNLFLRFAIDAWLLVPFRRTFDINAWDVLNSMKHEIAAMLKTGGGAIVNTSGIAGHIGLAQTSIYVATKHAVEELTKAVALEFAVSRRRMDSSVIGAITGGSL
jgi:NADP-dependent 3-hydroxy acid dehydrogenase YdfG